MARNTFLLLSIAFFHSTSFRWTTVSSEEVARSPDVFPKTSPSLVMNMVPRKSRGEVDSQRTRFECNLKNVRSFPDDKDTEWKTRAKGDVKKLSAGWLLFVRAGVVA